ncbi:pentapeptide repeat-containing protein [Marixanthomonas ophiurae]|uniref:Pentapeptide repeat-containing protein n=1 Tax=Marixanthomonas ophiurae TaxID=387659 RepID=A0A3E1Q919_9FLAO|nr:pentapeptide repeat-containing protein [Marixanthomonas ophiurae]RFN58618.1 pentapeptide repeat-containing protein [Marixanthomonas ophiurae]
MSPAYYTDKTFTKHHNIENPLPKGDYEGCTFNQCDFSNANLSDFRFIECEFIDCNISNVQLNKTALQDVTFTNCKLWGLRFEICSTFGFSIVFIKCQLNHASFYKMDVSRSSFVHCNLLEVDFTESNLSGCKLEQCDLQRAIFHSTNLEKTDFRTSTNYSINPERNKLKGALFSMPEVIGLLNTYNIHIEGINT